MMAELQQQVPFSFQLFVAGDTPNSVQALSNLTALCQAHLPGYHQIEVVDVFRDPGRALSEGIFLTPTLLRTLPAPVQRIVGTLSDTRVVLEALGLEAGSA